MRSTGKAEPGAELVPPALPRTPSSFLLRKHPRQFVTSFTPGLAPREKRGLTGRDGSPGGSLAPWGWQDGPAGSCTDLCITSLCPGVRRHHLSLPGVTPGELLPLHPLLLQTPSTSEYSGVLRPSPACAKADEINLPCRGGSGLCLGFSRLHNPHHESHCKSVGRFSKPTLRFQHYRSFGWLGPLQRRQFHPLIGTANLISASLTIL